MPEHLSAADAERIAAQTTMPADRREWVHTAEVADVLGSGPGAIYRVHVRWFRMAGLVRKRAVDDRLDVVDVEAATGYVTRTRAAQVCPFCREWIALDAVRCPLCQGDLDDGEG